MPGRAARRLRVRSLLLAALEDLDQAARRDVGNGLIDNLGRPLEHGCKATGGNDSHRAPELGLDARHDALNQADIAPEDAGMHAGHRVGANPLLWLLDHDARQQGRRAVQGLDAEVDSWCDGAAAVAALFIDHVEIRRGPEVDHEHRCPGKQQARTDGIADAVGTGPDTLDLDTGNDAGLTDEHRLAVEVARA